MPITKQLTLNLDAKSPRELNTLSDALWMIREQNKLNEQSKSREKLIQLQTLEEE